MTYETVLKLGSLIIPAGAGRGISQTLKPIDNGDLRRTVNGELTDLTRIQNRKFESQISVTDMSIPTLSGLWKGDVLSIECISKLNELVSPESATHTIQRDPVTDSIKGYDSSGVKVPLLSFGGTGNRDLTFDGNVAYIEFRPILEMMILSMSFNHDEYEAEAGWTIDLEEV